MTIDILPRAREDIIVGYRFYEKQAKGIGSRFRDAMFDGVEELRVIAGVHPQIHGYYRRLTRPFPFAIYYQVVGEAVRVHAILDCRRDPELLKQTLSAR